MTASNRREGKTVVRREFPEAPVAGVGAVVIEDGKVLLVRRGQEPLKGHWSLPGGALELGETLEEGVIREVREESGLEVEALAIVEVFDRITRDQTGGGIRYHYVLVDFLCRRIGGSVRCASDAEDARWVERKDLGSEGPYHLEPFTAMVIEKAFRMAAESGEKF
ncbi:MAG TPA: NUDIX hydrolase [Acidobacteriaceae bacterium]|nr:NUDIX hydrolase [Acidobacteriaceae bacterium]